MTDEADRPTADDTPEAPHHPPPRRLPAGWKGGVIVALLILVPLVYLCISFLQSRDAGRSKEESAEATGLVLGWPSRMQRRIYDIKPPMNVDPISFYEFNSWEKSSLYVEFTTNEAGLNAFMKWSDGHRSDLVEGYNPITHGQAKRVHWSFGDGSDWWGWSRPRPGAEPDLAVAVDLSDQTHPTVRVVSTTKF
ncbi:hypothetical protein SRB5_47510 [Streptomyces sp. RB5]|uniref:Uncharacterized protein n=1 Tax=Streptomyces smaragdinus TaxID=2585196 RepID=A0A7K0CMU4_9ACTN|nr:hypothetical protein [Streptomyces smaragdinus]MQY14583.1 hypothetical protein [Streptomyces smaragdinus]